MQSQRHDESGNNVRGIVRVCDLELENAVERDLNQLLDFFSCPMPALKSLSKLQQQIEIRRLVADDTFGKQDDKLAAHCNCFKDLQFLASEIRKRASKYPYRNEQDNST